MVKNYSCFSNKFWVYYVLNILFSIFIYGFFGGREGPGTGIGSGRGEFGKLHYIYIRIQ